MSGLSIGILSWGLPATLWKTLSSFRRHRLFERADECLIYFNEMTALDQSIARHFGIRSLGSPENIGIGRALTALVTEARGDTFLFLENDWELVEDAAVTGARLTRSLALLASNEVQLVRLRHRVRHGMPLFQTQCVGQEESAPPFLLDTQHWIDDPAARFPGRVSKRRIEGEDWFFSAARFANFTNNPCLYPTAFLRDRILPYAKGVHISLELDVNAWWLEEDGIRVAQGPGLFMHSRIDRGQPGPRWLRTLLGAVAKRYGIRRRGRIPVSLEVGGSWRSDL